MALPDPPIVGRPAVLWQLTDPEQDRLYCEAGELEDGRLRVRILQGSQQQSSAVFSEASDAIRWALEKFRLFTDAGWFQATLTH